MTVFTKKLGFRDDVLVLRVGFNDAGAIAQVHIDIEKPRNKGARLVAQMFARDITAALHSGISLKDLTQATSDAQRIHCVRGDAYVKSAASHFDMVYQVLERARLAAIITAQGHHRRVGNFVLIPGGLA